LILRQLRTAEVVPLSKQIQIKANSNQNSSWPITGGSTPYRRNLAGWAAPITLPW
jgi:hypothetical protein